MNDQQLTQERIFIYGSLGPGRPNEHVMAAIGGTWQPASLRGRLLEEGWGAELGFPGLVLDEQGQVIKGFVFSSANLINHWAALDAFEGEAYERVLATVKLDTGDSVQAYVYALRR